MTSVRASNGRNVPGVSGGREPIVHGRANFPSLHRRFTRTMMSGNQQQNPVAAVDRLFETSVDGLPCTVQSHAMEIEHAVGLDIAGSQTSVPSAVQRPSMVWLLPRRRDIQGRCARRARRDLRTSWPPLLFSRFFREFLAR